MPPSRRFQNGVCKAILFTSLVWLLLDVFILFYYLENSLFNYESSNKKRHGASLEHYEEISSNVHTQLRSLLEGLNFDPNGPGANGAGLTIDKANDAEMRQKFKQNQFNIMASDSISVNRTLSDYRTEKCKSVVINEEKLPTVSIIIVFHNEAWSTLLRTLHSVVNRSPLRLITEIILIDDCSNRDYLKEPLQLYCKRFPLPVHLIHLAERSGLIRARLAGSAMAKGKVLLFLDAHVEVTEGWLPPLLDRISLNNRRVVAPIIDVISDETFEYVTASDTTWGGFNWHLNFRWYPVPDREMTRRNWDRSLPIETPTIAGGLFAISKKYFYEIGSYDDGMQVWGGENLEISFRVWTCGGTLEIHPCSRVGHVFRKQTPYTFPGGTAKVIHHNARRTAEVWMDDYKQFFYSMVPTARYVEVGDITKRLALRKRLHCKPFSWYLEKIYTESPIPAHYHSIGQIMNDQTRICIDTMGKKSGQLAGMSACHGLGGNQAWCLTVNGEIRSDELCLSVKSQSVFLEKCASAKPNAKHIFAHDFEKKIIVHKKSNNCLTASTSDGTLSIKPCVQNLPASRWIVENFTENPK